MHCLHRTETVSQGRSHVTCIKTNHLYKCLGNTMCNGCEMQLNLCSLFTVVSPNSHRSISKNRGYCYIKTEPLHSVSCSSWKAFCKQNPMLCVSCQALRSAVCAQRRACSPSELAGRSPQRKISWRPLTRSSSPTPSSAPLPDTWPITECVWVSFHFGFLLSEEAELSQKNLVLLLSFLFAWK